MRRIVQGGIVALAIVLAARGTALAQSITGSWKATLGSSQFVFTFTSAGSVYKGTFTTTTTFVDAKGKRHTSSTVQQLTAKSKVANKQQTITVTIQPQKGALPKQVAIIDCTVGTTTLSCYSPVTKANVNFTLVKR